MSNAGAMGVFSVETIDSRLQNDSYVNRIASLECVARPDWSLKGFFPSHYSGIRDAIWWWYPTVPAWFKNKDARIIVRLYRIIGERAVDVSVRRTTNLLRLLTRSC